MRIFKKNSVKYRGKFAPQNLVCSILLRLTDKYVFAEAGASVSERFVSPIAPNIENGEVKITDGKTSASLFFDSDVFTPMLSTESFRRHDGSGEYVKVYVIDLEATVNTSEATFRFIIK